MATIQEKPEWAKSYLGRRTPDKANSWEIIAPKPITKPTVFCLSGNGSVSFKSANGFCKMAENLLGMKGADGHTTSMFDEVDLIGVKYGKTHEHDDCGSISDGGIISIVDRMLVPMCLDSNGNKLPTEEACKNMSLLTFFTFCHGAREVSRLFGTLKKQLQSHGFTPQEINQIISSTMQISYAPLVFDDPIPSVRAVSNRDELVGAFDDKRVLGHELNGVDVVLAEHGDKRFSELVYTQFGSAYILSSNLVNGSEFEEDEHYIDFLNRAENWKLKPAQVNGEEVSSKNADCVSQMMAYALTLSVVNSMQNAHSQTFIPKPTPQEMTNELIGIKSAFTQEELATNPIYLEKKAERDRYLEQLKQQRAEFLESFKAASAELEHITTPTEAAKIIVKYNVATAAKDLIPTLKNLSPEDKTQVQVKIEELCSSNEMSN